MSGKMSSPVLGIIGGLGPMATVYFYEMLTQHTEAGCDQDHIDMIISSRASTPDRTAFILGKSENSPISAMKEEAQRLINAGASLIVMPCNTAHYFYDELSRSSNVPIINIIEETVKHCCNKGLKRIGVLATEGTVRSRSYDMVCEKYGIECVVPNEENQKILNDIIYSQIKTGLTPDMDAFFNVCSSLENCDALILGCTELSLLKKSGLLDSRFIDSLEVLCQSAILRCGKTPVGFSF